MSCGESHLPDGERNFDWSRGVFLPLDALARVSRGGIDSALDVLYKVYSVFRRHSVGDHHGDAFGDDMVDLIDDVRSDGGKLRKMKERGGRRRRGEWGGEVAVVARRTMRPSFSLRWHQWRRSACSVSIQAFSLGNAEPKAPSRL